VRFDNHVSSEIRMDDKPALQSEIERARDHLFQQRLMLERLISTDEEIVKLAKQRIDRAAKCLKSLLQPRQRRST